MSDSAPMTERRMIERLFFLPTRLIALIQRPEIRGMVPVIAVKVLMVALNFGLIALAARTLDTDGFGLYSILFSAAGLLYIIGAAGQELFAIRAWNEHAAIGDTSQAKGAIHFSALACVAVTSVIAVLFYASMANGFGHDPILAVTALICVSAPLQITSHLLRTARGVAAGDGIANLLQSGSAIIYLALCLATGTPVTVAAVFTLLFAGGVAALATHVIMARVLIRQSLPNWSKTKPKMLTRAWIYRSSRLLGANALEATNQHVDVLMIGLLMSPSAAGAYFVTVRVANLFAAAADAINLFATRHFSRLYHGRDDRELHKLLDAIAYITLGFIGVGLLGIVVGGYFALQLIDAAYSDNYPELLVLCLGTAALAIARPSGSILMLTGHEGRYLATIAVTAILRIVALIALTPSFGVMGAVVATTMSFTLTAVVLRRSVISATGFDATVLRLLRGNHAGGGTEEKIKI
jgi:O-antigen/teichoic acid export membrane protein